MMKEIRGTNKCASHIFRTHHSSVLLSFFDNTVSEHEITGCPRHRDFAPGTEIFKARCLAGTDQKRFSSSSVVTQF